VKKEQALATRIHPRLRDWLFASFPGFTHAQLLCVPSVLNRESILLTSPTGSGKTLAGFLGVFDALVRELEAGELKPGVRCVYVSPLRALAYDIEKNMKAPIAGMGLEEKMRIHLRTGDTTVSERAKFRHKPSHFLVTTPESLAILLAQQNYVQHLARTEFVIVDELHSFAGNKRGADLSISLERLQMLRGQNNL
jgi:ATP-dependent Lhr-like helicase